MGNSIIVWYHTGGQMEHVEGDDTEYPAGWYLYDGKGTYPKIRGVQVDVYYPGTNEQITVCDGCKRINDDPDESLYHPDGEPPPCPECNR